MSTELLYTSAPQGLRHGSRGFCTVLTTAGMSINVIGKLEAISSYRHLFAPDSHQAGDNPISLAHQRLNLGGQLVSVISRVSAYGTDYTGRTNKIAHHVTINPEEMPAAGPAWLIRQRPFLRSEWLGQCETPATGPRIPRADQQPRICTTWKTIAGDAGWGGVVAEAITGGSAEPLWVIYPLQCQNRLLELMDESISLLPPVQRWRATFNTFAANIPPDVECKIRFVPVGTEEARFAASQGKAIDLTKHQSITTASQWVERARGLLRGDATAPISTGTFNAVRVDLDQQPVASVWSSENETPPGPPPPPQPPSLPPELIGGKQKKRQLIIGAAVFGILFGLGATWAVARHMVGLPVFSLSVPEPPAPMPVPLDPQTEEPVPFVEEVETTIATSDLKMHYDKKDVLVLAQQGSTVDTPLSSNVSLRGKVRLSPIETATDEEDGNPPSQLGMTGRSMDDNLIGNGSIEATAAFVSWGGPSESLRPKEDLLISTTMLTDTTQTLPVEQLPSVPPSLGGTKVYWSRQTGDLIAIAELDLSSDPGFLSDQAAAYKTYAVMLSKIATSVGSLQRERDGLPEPLKSLVDSFLDRSLRGDKDVIVTALIRKPSLGAGLSERATKLSESLQSKSKSASGPLEKSQQDALLRVVSDCGRIAQSSHELRRAHEVLQAGQIVEVPDLKFLDSEGVTLRRVPLRIHFSW